jgi:hypothetical protein
VSDGSVRAAVTRRSPGVGKPRALLLRAAQKHMTPWLWSRPVVAGYRFRQPHRSQRRTATSPSGTYASPWPRARTAAERRSRRAMDTCVGKVLDQFVAKTLGMRCLRTLLSSLRVRVASVRAEVLCTVLAKILC